MNPLAYTISRPIPIKTSANPKLNATISSKPNPTRYSEIALNKTTKAEGQGTIPPVTPSVNRSLKRTLL